jgi:Fe-S cluster assembly iron-binding protein IscA
MMLQITDNAANWMRGALSEEDESDDQCFRIIVTGRGLQLMRGEERPDDVVAYTHEDKVVLVLDGATAEFLKDLAVDYDTDTSELVIACVSRQQRVQTKMAPKTSRNGRDQTGLPDKEPNGGGVSAGCATRQGRITL